ncbi:MAG: winged helix-turn-helix domain-containing protein [Acetobacteraceae bacterium]
MRFVFAGHELDLRRRELRRAAEVVHMEPQVYDLLVHLVRNRDRVVSKDELFDTIWNGRIVSEAALSSRINAARKAVGDDGERQTLIKTMHRRGFRFIGAAEEIAEDVAPAPSPQEEPASQPDERTVCEPAPDRRPSVVVLPFANLNHESEKDYFSYGLTEDVIRLLARNRWLDVLSRHSGAAFRGQDVDPREIGAALGVRYLVQGSVLKLEDRVRITAGLVSAETGRHLWGESYDTGLSGFLDVQTTMAEKIAAVIEPELARLEREAAVRRQPVTVDAWDCYQRGLWHLWGFTIPGLAEGEAMFREAIALDPNFARAYGALAYVLLQRVVLRPPDERATLLAEALHHGRTAVTLDDQDCMNLCVVGRVLCFQHEYDDAVAYLEDAIAVNPSFAQAYFAMGFTLIACGRPGDAIGHLDRAHELSPRDPHLASFHAARALAYLALGDLDAAMVFARRAMRVPTTNHWPFATLAALLGLLGREYEARRAVEGLLSRYPDYTTETAESDFFFCADDVLVNRYLEGLRLAGVPDPGSAAAVAAAAVSARRGAARRGVVRVGSAVS